ncbi:hypothetical protein EST38_g8498 [Candolleomyces aberdarensis]|uniref:Uncharacterized protein n=1 Tax=Candolleomyces aberdarensis TaxID=2316362 RepID=A0A4Q2DE49_9AGAR|nr:hypothetical protein EST38_g8498 [Candolleomyces aberdarensis]
MLGNSMIISSYKKVSVTFDYIDELTNGKSLIDLCDPMLKLREAKSH